MLFDLDSELSDMLNQHIEHLERTNLEAAVPDEFDLEDVFHDSEQVFFSIRGLADFWSAHAGIEFGQCMTDLVVAAHNQQLSDLTFLLVGTPKMLTVLISLGAEVTTRTILEGIFPGIEFHPITAKKLLPHIHPHVQVKGIITGIPSRKTFAQGKTAPDEDDQKQKGSNGDSNSHELSQLERVIRGMHGATWAYIVQAHPRPRRMVVKVRLETIDLLAEVTSRARTQWQSTQQGSRNITSVESTSQTRTVSGESVNYRAQYLIKLLERELERLNEATAAGQWTVRTYFGANTFDDAQRLASLLMGTLAGKESRPDPLRATVCQAQGVTHGLFSTFLSSEEVAAFLQFPREEVPGYAIHDYVSFDVDFHSPSVEALALGHIQQNGRDIHDTYTIGLDALAKHVVVVGVTGSGKTTTVMNLLDAMVEAEKPFLVIEPAKTEYRALRNALTGRSDLRIYTLGNENIAPFRLNPFEFETGEEQGEVSLLSHIDFLKAVFNAAFVLYSPMPHVLEDALHEVYEDKGWDLASGMNQRVPDWKERHLYPIFPTLSDLYYKIEIVTNRLGYHHEVESNVKAGLKSRIGSLLIGSKGLMLDTARGIPMSQLLAYPTIMELENIGNDDEKTFLMGLFLARLYEYRRLQSATGKLPSGLQHLIVFEEAHRLLKNTTTQVDSESSNMRAQAIEVFTNMLSEVRAYGQGVLVAEQIPSKLAPDVLKNTNLKIVHRLIAQDDRESIGQTMNLNTKQVMHLGVLSPGMAAVYAEGADHAYLVRLENYKRHLMPFPDAQLKEVSSLYASVKTCWGIQNFEHYGFALSRFGVPDTSIYQAAHKILRAEKSTTLWATILLRAMHGRAQLLTTITKFSEYIETALPHLAPQQHDRVLSMVIVQGAAEVLHERGVQFGWGYPLVEELRLLLTRGLLLLLKSHSLEDAGSVLDEFTLAYIKFSERRQGPFAGCTHCHVKCMYRTDVRNLLSEKDRERVEDELRSTEHATHEERYGAVAWVVSTIAERWLGEMHAAVLDIGYCAALHTIGHGGYSEYEQEVFGENLNDVIIAELKKAASEVTAQTGK